MPRGLIRYEHTDHFHFLTFSCYHRQQHLSTTTARNLFEDALELTRLRYRPAVWLHDVGYADFFHIKTPQGSAPTFGNAQMHDVKLAEAEEKKI